MNQEEIKAKMLSILSRVKELGCIEGQIDPRASAGAEDLVGDAIQKAHGRPMSPEERDNTVGIAINLGRLQRIDPSLAREVVELGELMKNSGMPGSFVAADMSAKQLREIRGIDDSETREHAESIGRRVEEARNRIPAGYSPRFRSACMKRYLPQHILDKLLSVGMIEMAQVFSISPEDLAKKLGLSSISEFVQLTDGIGEFVRDFEMARIEMERAGNAPEISVNGSFAEHMDAMWKSMNEGKLPAELEFIALTFDRYGINWNLLTAMLSRSVNRLTVEATLTTYLEEDFTSWKATGEAVQDIVSELMMAVTAYAMTTMRLRNEQIKTRGEQPTEADPEVAPNIAINNPVCAFVIGEENQKVAIAKGVTLLNDLTPMSPTDAGMSMLQNNLDRVQRGILRDFLHLVSCKSRGCNGGHDEFLKQNPELANHLKNTAIDYLEMESAATGKPFDPLSVSFTKEVLRQPFFAAQEASNQTLH